MAGQPVLIPILKSILRRPKMLKVGDPAPEFAVQDHTGAMRRLSGYRGRHVVLWFYPKADTPG
jgi:peroxiredoxin